MRAGRDYIESLAAGLLDGGCEFATNYPGFRSNELTDRLGCAITSVDEKNAFAVAWGASLAGRRSVVAFKNVGLNDAADPFLNAMVLGVNGGLVVVVFDDVDVEHSQVRMDSRPYRDFFGGLWLEPSCAARAYELGYEAFVLSERFSTPVVIRVTNILALLGREVPRRPPRRGNRAFVRDPARWVVHPKNAASQERALAERNRAIEAWADEQGPGPSLPPSTGPIVLSVGGRTVGRRAPPPDLSIETYPLPRPVVEELIRSGRRLIVQERGAPYVARRLREAMAGDRVDAVALPPVKSAHEYHDSDRHEPLFAALRQIQDRVVVGDLGGYTMDPHRTLDACLCYGTSVGVATGFAVAAPSSNVLCVTGDGAFFHSGKSAVLEAAARGARLALIVLDNGGCRGTGGQSVPGDFAWADERVRMVETQFSKMGTTEHLKLLSAPDRPRLLVVRMRIDS